MKSILFSLLFGLVSCNSPCEDCNTKSESNTQAPEPARQPQPTDTASKPDGNPVSPSTAPAPAAPQAPSQTPGGTPSHTKSSTSEPAGEGLKPGDLVPDFSLPSQDGKTFRLSDYRGKRVLISAYPKATTTVCSWQTEQVSSHVDDYSALNTVTVGLSVDAADILDAWATEKHFQQWLLSDSNPKGKVSQSLGIWNGLLGVTNRANLIVDVDGKLLFKRVYGMSEKPDFDEVMAVLGKK